MGGIVVKHTIVSLLALLGAFAIVRANELPVTSQAERVVTPEQLAEAKNIERIVMEQGEFTVRFRVQSAKAASGVSGQFVLKADAKIGDQTGRWPSRDYFKVELSPKAQSEMAKAGMGDLKKHFAGKEVEVLGRVEAIDYWCFPILRAYTVRVESAKQIRAVR